MPKCEFSETQFESYHARAFERMFGGILPQFFPTRAEEGKLGYDMKHIFSYETYFFQYKVPYYILQTNYKCKDLSGDCFHITLSNSNGPRSIAQYRTLKKLSVGEPHVYYTAPLFGTNDDFAKNFIKILDHTVYFNLRDSGFPKKNELGFSHPHTLYYSNQSDYSWLYSEPSKIQTLKRPSNETVEPDDNLNLRVYIVQLNQKLRRIIQEEASPARFKENINNEDDSLQNELENRLVAREGDSIEKNIVLTDILLKKYFNLNWFIKPTL